MIIFLTILVSLIIISLTKHLKDEIPRFVYFQYCFLGSFFIYMILSWIL